MNFFKDILLKKCGAYLAATAVFLAAAYIYCSPVFSGKTVGGADNSTSACVAQESLAFRAETGQTTWWNGAVFSGMPNYQLGGGKWESDALLRPVKILLNGPGDIGWRVFLYFICFFIMLRSFGVGKWLSIPGALATGLSSYFLVIIAAGHMSKCVTIALVALVVAGFKFIFDKKYIPGALLTMFFVALGFPPHPQMFYYYFMMLGLFWIAELYIHVKEKRFRDLAVATAIFCISVGIGLGARCSNFLANSEYISQTIRNGSEIGASAQEGGTSSGLDLEYATQWSYGIDETLSFLIPGIKGGANSVDVGRNSSLYRSLVRHGVSSRQATGFCANAPMYWGEQPFTAGNVYMGAIVCFLFVLGLMIVKGPYKWALLAATLFSTALAWGSNFMGLTEFFFKYFPMYSKYRTVSSILIVAEVAMPIMAFLALKEIFEGSLDRKYLIGKSLAAAGITGGICLLLALFGNVLFDFRSSYDAAWSGNLPAWLYEAIVEQRAAILKSDCWRSLLFIAAALLGVLLYLKGALKKGWLIALVGVLVVWDMWPVDKRYFNDSCFVSQKSASSFPMQPYEKALLDSDKSHFRVFNLTVPTFSDARTSYYLKSVGGYSAVKLSRYQDLIDMYLGKGDMKVAGMLNAKYAIVQGEDSEPRPVPNPDALGNAWFVGKVWTASNPLEECESLARIDLSREAVFCGEHAAQVSRADLSLEGCSVSLDSYTPKDLDYTCDSPRGGVVVFSEIYYPYGWKATIDGQNAPILRANYVLRALQVPPGRHNIHFTFDPDSVRKGERIAIVFILAMYLLLAGAVARFVFKKIKGARK